MTGFNYTSRIVSSEFESFCKKRFGEEIGKSIYKFILRFSKKIKIMNMFGDVTPVSRQRIMFIEFLYNEYGIKNILIGIDIFYKQLRLNIVDFDTHSFSYFKKIVSSPDITRVENITSDAWPVRMSSTDLNRLKKDISEFEKAYSYFMKDEKEYTRIIMEKACGVESSKLEVQETQKSELVIPIQKEKLKTKSFSEYENYRYQCPVCGHTNQVFNLVCGNCEIEFDYSGF